MGHASRAAGKIGALLAVVLAFTAQSASAQCADPFAMPVQQGSVDFTQTRHLSGVRVPLVSTGRATIAAQRIDWRVTHPMAITTTITPSGVTQSVEGGPAQRVGPQGGGDAFLSSAGLLDILTGDVSSLRTHYDVTRGGSANAWIVTLAPKSEALSRHLTAIEIGGCERIERVNVRQANGDRMEIQLRPAEN